MESPSYFDSRANPSILPDPTSASGSLLLAGDSLEETASEQPAVRYRKLGELFAYGGSLGKNPERAASLFKKAASLGDAQAAFYLAMALREGFGLSKNLTESFAWLRVAASKNFPEASYELAYSFQNGIGCEADLTKADQLFERAAQQKFPKAVAKMLRASVEAAEPNVEEVVFWVNEGSDDIPEAMAAKAKGLLCQNDPEVLKALSLLEKGALSGNAECLKALASFWYEGKYLASDKGVALAFAHMAATAGDYVAAQWLEDWREKAAETDLVRAAELAAFSTAKEAIAETAKLKAL